MPIQSFQIHYSQPAVYAVKYSCSAGQVEVSAHNSGDPSQIIFAVKDNGKGIAEDKKPFIFDSTIPRDTGTNNEKGNGIGLSLCKEFVQENGGHIWFESEPGKGSTFYFSIKASA